MLLAFNNYLEHYDCKMSLSIMNRMKISSQKHLIMLCWFPKPENGLKQGLRDFSSFSQFSQVRSEA